MLEPSARDRAVQNRSADQDEPGPPPQEGDEASVLRAKYLDYCSARLSEVFLSLSEERIFDLVEEAARQGRLNVAELAFDDMVRLATEKLRQSVPLPDFETWAREYREDPDRYDPYLLGLWEESDLADPGEDPSGSSGAGEDG